MKTPFLHPLLEKLLENKIYWWYILTLFAVSLFVGIIIANFLYRGMSWSSMITSDYRWHWDGLRNIRSTGFEEYLFIIGIITLIVFVVLNYFESRMI